MPSEKKVPWDMVDPHIEEEAKTEPEILSDEERRNQARLAKMEWEQIGS